MPNELKRCPFCGEEILAIAIKCKHCGSMLDDGAPGTPLPSSPGGVVPAWAAGTETIPAGTWIREYRILRLLGAGGMGEVYEAEHGHTEQRVAIKAVRPGLMADQGMRRRFLEEGRVMARLKHPNIVALHTFFEEAGRLFLVMECIDGVTLEDLLEARRLSVQQAISIARRVFQALDYAHTRPSPVVHRDIKPPNVMLEREGGRVVVMDFGIAKALDREKLTHTGGHVGTVEYMSPEQVQGMATTPASDLYSLGVLLYRMLAGTVPFSQTSTTGIEVMDGHRHKPPPSLLEHCPECPKWLAELTLRFLAKEPEERIAAAEVFKDRLPTRGGTAAKEPVVEDSVPPVSPPEPEPSLRFEPLSPPPAPEQPSPPPRSEPSEDQTPLPPSLVSPAERSTSAPLALTLIGLLIAGVFAVYYFGNDLNSSGKRKDRSRSPASGDRSPPQTGSPAATIASPPAEQELMDHPSLENQEIDLERQAIDQARIHLDASENEKALSTLTMCKECQGQEYLLLLVTAMQRNEMLERALQTAQAALENDKNNIDLLILMSEISGQTGRHNSAMDYLRDVLRLRPEHRDAAMRLAKLFLEIKQPANAREILLQAEKYNEDDLPLEEMLVEINLQMNDDSGAASALRKVHKLKPDDIDVRLRLVEILVRLGNFKETVPHFDVLARKDLITSKLRPGYAMALREVGRMDDAMEMLKTVLRDDPSDYQTARNLATIYLGNRDYFKAREYLEMARRSRSKDPEVHHLIGTCCLKTEDWECALLSYTRAVELEQTNLLYRTEYAKILYHLSETDEARRKSLQRMALEQFNTIIERYDTDASIPAERKDPDIYTNRGRIYFALGFYDKALNDFRVAVSIDQQRVDLVLAMGDALFHVNKRSDAKKYYREVLDTGQNLAHANFYLGKIHMVEGNSKKAKAHFLDTIDAEFKKFPDAHRYLGNIYKEARFRDMAIKYYRNYLSLVPPNTPQARDVRNTIQRIR